MFAFIWHGSQRRVFIWNRRRTSSIFNGAWTWRMGCAASTATTSLAPEPASNTRLAAEAQKDGWDFCWGRVFYPYGVGEHPARLCSSLIQKLQRGEKLALKTPNSLKDYIYIEDLAAAILLTMEKKFTGTINWGAGTGVSVREIAEIAATRLGRPELVENQNPPAVDPFPFVVAESTKLQNLGWRPQVDLQTGLSRLAWALSGQETVACRHR
jgi:nucleoside-diphosphate-sugar epimerase